jgi:hypothetical protein
MLVESFSHTELARAFALFGIAELLRWRTTLAAACFGLTFATNAIFGCWMAMVFAISGLPRFWRMVGAGTPGAAIRWLMPAAVAFAVPAVPVAVWILSRPEVSVAVDFDYREFLWSYYPKHFFIGASLWWPLIQMVAATAAACVAARVLEQRRDIQRLVLIIAGIFFLGIIVGEVASSRTMLQMHFLRIDGILILLATTLVGAALIAQVRSGQLIGFAAAALGTLALFTGVWPIVLVAVILSQTRPIEAFLARNLPATIRALLASRRFLGACAALTIAFCVAANAYVYLMRIRPPAGIPENIHLAGSTPLVRDWVEVQHWVRANTPPTAVFLLPASISDDFRVGAQRRIWVGMKDGAAAMWAPSTYHQWRQRALEIRSLGSDLTVLNGYACTHGIDYLVIDLRSRGGQRVKPQTAVYANSWFEVHKASCGS